MRLPGRRRKFGHLIEQGQDLAIEISLVAVGQRARANRHRRSLRATIEVKSQVAGRMNQRDVSPFPARQSSTRHGQPHRRTTRLVEEFDRRTAGRDRDACDNIVLAARTWRLLMETFRVDL